MLPLSDRCLVLPNVAVAELSGQRNLVCQPGDPAWPLGWIDWRQQRLPLIGFEAVDMGPLMAARYLEPFAMTWIHMAFRQGMGRRFAFGLLRRG